jgi:hypothetical protein
MVGAAFIAVGVLGLDAVGWEGWWFFGLFIAMGAVAALVGAALVRARVAVDNTGITKSSWKILGGFRVPWTGVESWSVSPYLDDDSFTSRVAAFKIRGKRWPVLVHDSEAFRPSFHEFIEEVRVHAVARET